VLNLFKYRGSVLIKSAEKLAMSPTNRAIDTRFSGLATISKRAAIEVSYE